MFIQIYKGYQIKPSKNAPGTLVVVTDGKGGKIPAVLDTLFTSRGLAMTEIDSYLRSKTKEVTNAQEINTATS